MKSCVFLVAVLAAVLPGSLASRPHHLRSAEVKAIARAAAEKSLQTANRFLAATSGVADIAESISTPRNASSNASSVLLFWAVGSEDRVIDLVMENVNHLRSTYPGRVDVYLAHYDEKKDVWLRRDGAWYQKNVLFSADKKGYKFQLMRALLTKSDLRITAYDWVWALDEDIDFSQTNLVKLFEDAQASEALLALPAFRTLNQDADESPLSYPYQEPHPQCRFRYAPTVEVIFPLIRPAALWQILTECDHCMHEHSVWGLDRVWCAFSARQLGRSKEKACAILDQTPVIHRNFQSLPGKYKHGGHLSSEFVSRSTKDKVDVQKHHPEDFKVGDGSTFQAYSCVSSDGKVEVVDHMANLRHLGESFGWAKAKRKV